MKPEQAQEKAAAQRWMLLSQQMPLALIEWDATLHVLDWNPAAERLFGFTKAETLGQSALDFLVPENAREHVRTVGQNLLEQKRPVRSINENLTKDGRILICDWYNTPLVDNTGQVIGLNSLVLDITERVQAKRALSESEERHRMTLESSPDPIVIYDMEGRAEYVNPAFVQTFGWTESELIGKRIAFVPPQATDETMKEIQALFSGGKITGHNTKRQTKDGRLLDVQLSAAAYRDKDGKPVGSIVVLRDVTQQRRAEEALRHSEERYRTLLEQIKEGYYEINLDGQLTFCNNSLGEVLGYPRNDLLTRRIDDLMDANNAANLRQLAQQVFITGQPATAQDCEIITKSGERKYIEISALAMRDEQGKPAGYRGLARDITERKRSQAELQQAKEAAETANRAKSVFLANMSHELRTPLNAILGYSEMLQEDAAALGYVTAAADLQKIQAAGRHLLDLINNILDLSKIEAGKMDLYLERFELAALVEEVQTTIQPLAAKNKNTLVISNPPDSGTMVADVTKIRQTLFNLLSNACKFTSNGIVRLELERQLSDGIDWVIFRVIDTGIGLNADQINELFKEFTQADSSTTRKYGGTGLGLAISRHFTNMMHGDIYVESAIGQGTTFTVRLPADVAQRKTQPANRAANHLPPNGTVLVIDDDPSVRTLLTRYLTQEGFRVETAADGERGLQLAKQIRPDAITLDVLMPNKDGWTILAALKADLELAAIPVIMLSITDDKQMGFSLGATDYLTKPIDRNQLLLALNRHTHGAADKNHILIVEDDPATRTVISQALRTEGWFITSVENGRAALSSLNVKLPDLILLDLMMPEMDGFQFLAELRKNAAWTKIPIIVMTGLSLSEAETSQLNGQVERILQKNADGHDTLLREVHELITNYIRAKNP